MDLCNCYMSTENHSWVQFLYYSNQTMLDRSKYLGEIPSSYEDTVHELLANERHDDLPPEGVDNKYWDQRYRLFSRFQQIDCTTGQLTEVILSPYHIVAIISKL